MLFGAKNGNLLKEGVLKEKFFSIYKKLSNVENINIGEFFNKEYFYED
jgi:hypothetical protein